MVTFQLINAYCKHLLTYACECIKFNRSDLSELDRAWNSGKYLKLMTRIALLIFRLVLGTYPISMDIDTRKVKYISKLKLSKNRILAGLFKISGYLQLTKVLSDYNMPNICNNVKEGVGYFLCENVIHALLFLFLLYFLI